MMDAQNKVSKLSHIARATYIRNIRKTVRDILVQNKQATPDEIRRELAKLLPENGGVKKAADDAALILNVKRSKTALIMVDPQNDFSPGGALAVPNGDEVMPKLNALQSKVDIVVATQDWHPENHESFAVNHPGKNVFEQVDLNGLPQTLWPVHCVQGSKGAEFHPALDTSKIDKVFQKGTDPTVDSYSGLFDNGHRHSTGLGEWLKAQGVTDVYVGGLATDYCVKFTALDAKGMGFNTHFVEDASRGVNLGPNDVKNAIDDMKRAGIKVVNADNLGGDDGGKSKGPDCGTGAGGFKPGNTCGVKNTAPNLFESLTNRWAQEEFSGFVASTPQPEAEKPATGQENATLANTGTPEGAKKGWEGRRIGIYGGSFSPLHKAHIAAAEYSKHQLGLDKVFFVPAKQNPLKGTAPMADTERVAMLKGELADKPWAEVDERELKRGGVSYTVDTLREYQKEHPDAELHYIIGADNLGQLSKWKEPDEIAKLARIAVAPRAGYPKDEIPAPFMGTHIEMMPSSISSTEIRARLKSGKPIDDLVPASVSGLLSNSKWPEDERDAALSQAVVDIAEPLSGELAPLRERLQAIADMGDGEEMYQAMDNLRAEIPALFKKSMEAKETSQAMHRLMNEYLFDGMFDAAEIPMEDKSHFGVFAAGVALALAFGLLPGYSQEDVDEIGEDILDRSGAMTKILKAGVFSATEDALTRDLSREDIGRLIKALEYNKLSPEDGLTDQEIVRRAVGITAETAKGFGTFKVLRQPSYLERFPMQLFYRVEERINWRPWPDLWLEAGGPPLIPDDASDYDEGIMVAPIGSSLWGNLNQITPGDPWPPFAWGSGMGVRVMSHEECVDRGVFGDDYDPEPVEDRDLNDNFKVQPDFTDDINDVLSEDDELGDYLDNSKKDEIGQFLNNAPYTDPTPTESQAVTGNFAKRDIYHAGLHMKVETEKGGIRRKVIDGKTLWEVPDFPASYGYIKRVGGGTSPEMVDGDKADVYFNEPPVEDARVFVIDQVNAKTGAFDEHKFFIGYPGEETVLGTYHRAFSDGKSQDRIGALNSMSMDEFKQWLKDGDIHKPFDAKVSNTEAAEDSDAMIPFSAWALGSWPEDDEDEVKSDGPGVMPTIPEEQKIKNSGTSAGVIKAWRTRKAAESSYNRIDALLKSPHGEGSVITPLPHADTETAALVEDAPAVPYLGSVPISKVVATQEWVYPDTIRKNVNTYGDNISPGKADVVLYKGKYYVQDGHHKIVAAKLMGADKLIMSVRDFDKSEQVLDNSIDPNETVSNAGKPCGDSFIDENLKCHAGEGINAGVFRGNKYSMGDLNPLETGKYTKLDRDLIDLKKVDRPLNVPTETERIKDTIPSAKFIIPYSQVPFFDRLNALQGSDPLRDRAVDYVAARKNLFEAQPVEKIPIKDLTFTQHVVNRNKIARNVEEEKNKIVFVVRYRGSDYVMDGHHTIVARAKRGKSRVRAHVLKIGKDESIANTGKPCGDSHIAEGDTCHVGEGDIVTSPTGMKYRGVPKGRTTPVNIYHTYDSKSAKDGKYDVRTYDFSRGAFGLTESIGHDPMEPNEYGDKVHKFELKPDAKVFTADEQHAAIDKLFDKMEAERLTDKWDNADGRKELNEVDAAIGDAARKKGFQVLHYTATEQYGDEWAVIDPTALVGIQSRNPDKVSGSDILPKISGIGLGKAAAVEKAKEIASSLFGPPKGDHGGIPGVIRAGGAQPGDRVKVQVVKEGLEVWVSGRGYASLVGLPKDGGQATLRQLIVTEPGKQTGTRLFGRIVNGLTGSKFTSIKMEAKGGDPAWQGAYVWPRLGAVSDNDDHELAGKAELAGFGPNISRVEKLMDTKERRDWWKENNHTVDVHFDLAPDSHSMKTLNAYLKQTGI